MMFYSNKFLISILLSMIILGMFSYECAAAQAVLENITIQGKGHSFVATGFFTHIPQYRKFTIKDKNYIVYDFKNCRLSGGTRNIKIRDGYINEVSVGQYNQSTTRIVFRANGKRQFTLKHNGNSIIWTLKGLPAEKKTSSSKIPAVDKTSSKEISKNIETPKIEKVVDAKKLEVVKKYSKPESSEKAKVAKPEITAVRTSTAAQLMLPEQFKKPSPPRKSAPGAYIPIVVIDPGHGGKDPGAVIGGIREKDIVLPIAEMIKEKLDATCRVKAFLTRTDDQYLSLEARTRVAGMYFADIFVSIHADSVSDRNVSGVGVYYLSTRGASSKAAEILAAKENAPAAIIGDVSLGENPQVFSILMDLEQTKTLKDSAIFAGLMERELIQFPSLSIHGVHQAGFIVLQSIDIPSLLVEVGFISNSKERKKLLDLNHQERIADAIANACESFLFRYMLATE